MHTLKNELMYRSDDFKLVLYSYSFIRYIGLVIGCQFFYVDGDSELIRHEESKLLGEILKGSDINVENYGIDIEELAEGKSTLTYEEMEYVLKENPATHILSLNLKEELSTSMLIT